MKIALPQISLLISCMICLNSTAQTLHEVSQPDLELQDNKLVITYEIKKYNEEDKFTVWIEVTDADGSIIKANSLVGDIGDDITGGKNKKIIWDFQKDKVSTEADIFVQVNAEIKAPDELVAEEQVQEETISEESLQQDKVNKGAVVISSALFPGLGFVKMNKSKLHLIKGAAGYACITSAIIFNRLAVSNYNKYLESFEITNSDSYFKKSARQDNLSEVFAYTAIGIWAAEIVWVIIESGNYNGSSVARAKTFTVEPVYDANTRSTMISFSYKF